MMFFFVMFVTSDIWPSDNDKITKDLVAFANSRGGLLVFGVEDKTGRVEGHKYDRVQAISSMAGNMAENNIVPPLYISSYTEEIEGKTILVVEVPFGNNKPYKTKKLFKFVRLKIL